MHRLKNDPFMWRKVVPYYSTGYTLATLGEPTFDTFPYKTWRTVNHSRPQSLLEASVRGPGGSGDTEFEVLESLSFTTKA